MGFVCVVADAENMIIHTDGMITKEENGSLVEIKSDYKHFEQISTNQFIAFLGPYEVCKNIDIQRNDIQESLTI
ncbi:hypothetical protein [Bacillus gaemokensis]|uniref:Uncharacterized protein n=1 Tax=Bacillus gaemokensis TaxID=574375 RepID=A0A073KFA6_9BACI|nr:hypothetical protein [Bacillus gaemokensis]KEK25206.1 hypothetical protein BAGA_11265 [Bacillus gaemokensis]KYG37351.1 hypothetical protein AZF08_08070 [Bacillus gaemokensis]